MSRKIEPFPGVPLSAKAVLGSALEDDAIEAVVIVGRRNGVWECGWGGDIQTSGMCMASMHLQWRVTGIMHGDHE